MIFGVKWVPRKRRPFYSEKINEKFNGQQYARSPHRLCIMYGELLGWIPFFAGVVSFNNEYVATVSAAALPHAVPAIWVLSLSLICPPLYGRL